MVVGSSRAGFVVLAVLLTTGCQTDGVLEPQSQLDAVARSAACAVCGEAVVESPAWIAQVVFEDGSSAFFDGPRDLFEYMLSRSRYLPAKYRLRIDAVFVTDYAAGELIDAKSAYFVNGSAVYGPRGRQLVPLSSLEAAEALAGNSSGSRIIRYGEITPAVLRTLNRPQDEQAARLVSASESAP
jgi:nitrous oxide reductase accessory protein NosL